MQIAAAAQARAWPHAICTYLPIYYCIHRGVARPRALAQAGIRSRVYEAWGRTYRTATWVGVAMMVNGATTALFVAALLPAACAQQTIVVGGSDGWVVKPGNAAYDDIIANVGDTLQFTYSSWYHDVMLVDNADCDFTTGQMLDETGDFAWTIEEPGTYIFACARSDHCSAGNQQVTVRVAGGSGGSGGTTMCRPDGSTCPILIDVRTLDEWNGGHASCATRLPVQDDASLVAQIIDLAGGDMSIPIVTYCYSGGRAGAAETIISNAGFESVTNGGGFITPAGNDAVLEEMCTCNTPCASSGCAEDLDADGIVNVNDLLSLLSGKSVVAPTQASAT